MPHRAEQPQRMAHDCTEHERGTPTPVGRQNLQLCERRRAEPGQRGRPDFHAGHQQPQSGRGENHRSHGNILRETYLQTLNLFRRPFEAV